MNDVERLKEYIEGVRKELIAKDVFSGEYCMMVLVGKSPKFSYRDLAHFESRVLTDISNTDPQYNIEFVCLIFED